MNISSQIFSALNKHPLGILCLKSILYIFFLQEKLSYHITITSLITVTSSPLSHRHYLIANTSWLLLHRNTSSLLPHHCYLITITSSPLPHRHYLIAITTSPLPHRHYLVAITPYNYLVSRESSYTIHRRQDRVLEWNLYDRSCKWRGWLLIKGRCDYFIAPT